MVLVLTHVLLVAGSVTIVVVDQVRCKVNASITNCAECDAERECNRCSVKRLRYRHGVFGSKWNAGLIFVLGWSQAPHSQVVRLCGHMINR
jgi:hypothetical protein